jgi:hypothetical protein
LLLLFFPCYCPLHAPLPRFKCLSFLFGMSSPFLILFLTAAPSTIVPCSSRIYLPRIVLPLSATLSRYSSVQAVVLTSFPELLDPPLLLYASDADLVRLRRRPTAHGPRV